MSHTTCHSSIVASCCHFQRWNRTSFLIAAVKGDNIGSSIQFQPLHVKICQLLMTTKTTYIILVFQTITHMCIFWSAKLNFNPNLFHRDFPPKKNGIISCFRKRPEWDRICVQPQHVWNVCLLIFSLFLIAHLCGWQDDRKK